MKKVDIVIPVFNRWRHTKQTLDSLFENTSTELFNLYVIEDGSTEEECARGVREYPKQFTRILHVTPIGPGPSRNQACREITEKHGRSEYLYMSDNDVYFTSGWLEKLVDVFEHSEADDIKVLGASCHPYLQSSSHIYCDVHEYKVGIKDAVSGYSQLMTWNTWDTFGPFDETMRNAPEKIMGSEDWAFCQKIVKAGYKVGSIEPEVVIPCGKTNTYGRPATGAETFKNIKGVLVW